MVLGIPALRALLLWELEADTFAKAIELDKALREPVLSKGTGFSQTDLFPAIEG